MITCLYTRAINLVISHDLSTNELLRSLQMHVFQYGMAEFILSDLGSQIVSAADIISNYLNDPETLKYLKECGSKLVKFEQYFKGKHELGSMVEICVKLSKKLIFGAIRNNVLPLRDFEYIVAQTVHIVNRRPIAFKDSLRDSEPLDLPDVITPEKLIHGFSLPSVSVIPSIHLNNFKPENLDPSFEPGKNIQVTFEKLGRVRAKLFEIYQNEFLPNLIKQATDSKSRYLPVSHDLLNIGDIVLIKEDNMKRCNFPMGMVKSISHNELGEVNGVMVYKGTTRELVKRHPNAIIPLLKLNLPEQQPGVENSAGKAADSLPVRSRRKAALESEIRSRNMLEA